MDSWADKVVLKWQCEGVKVSAAASINTIESAETTLGFKFPEDFKLLYLKINGFRDLDWQEHMFYFWPLERILEEYDDSTDKNFVGFCDFLLASLYIGFRTDRPGIFKMYSICKSSEEEKIADSFEQIVGMINSSDDLIY
jgi:hypothetical protein